MSGANSAPWSHASRTLPACVDALDAVDELQRRGQAAAVDGVRIDDEDSHGRLPSLSGIAILRSTIAQGKALQTLRSSLRFRT